MGNNADIELLKTKQTFMKKIKSVLKTRKKEVGYPYYISFEESNEWILRNLWYLDSKQRKRNRNQGMQAPLLNNSQLTQRESAEMLSLLSNDLDLSDDELDEDIEIPAAD